MDDLSAGNGRVIFAAMSKRNFYLRERITKYILEQGMTPACAFMMFSYFLLDTVDKKILIRANNDLIRRSDELWVFGEVSSGVEEEIKLAKKLGLPLKFYKAEKGGENFAQIREQQCRVEQE